MIAAAKLTDDDATLLRDYAEDRSETAFAELVRRHVNLVYSAALRQVGGDAATAQDVAQNVFTELARQAHRLAWHPALTGWLYTTPVEWLAMWSARKFAGNNGNRKPT